MVMELGLALSGTRWTSNSPRPFSRAPGAGNGMRGLHETGFASEIVGDPINVVGRGPFTVTQNPVAAGQIPSLLIQFVYTDRGLVDKTRADQMIRDALARDFKVSKATSFEPVAASWRMVHETQADFYYPVIASPAKYAGLRYNGSLLPTYPHSVAEANALLARLPSNIYVYTLAITSKSDTMTDAEAAQALTIMRGAMTAMANAGMNAYAHVPIVRTGSAPDVFGSSVPTTVATLGVSSLALVIAFNLLSSHIGSERL
jgi:hypothetical protein